MSPLLQCPIWDFEPGHWRRHARTTPVSPRNLAQKPPRQGQSHPLTFSPSISPAGTMSRPGLLAVLLLAVPAISLPVTNDMNKGDTKVMKCIVEVISDTLSKPNPLPISEECLETLRGDERIISILRHQNLLKELQEIAAQDAAGEHPKEEQPTGSLAEVAAQKPQQNEDSREEGKNSLEEREPRPRDANPGEKEYQEQAESNEIRDTEDAQRDEALDNHTSKDFSENEQQQQEDEEKQLRDPRDSLELEDEEEQPSRKDQEQSRETAGEHGEREDDRGDDATEDPTEAERSLDLAEEDEEMQGDDSNNDALGFGKDEQSSEEEEDEDEEEEQQPRALRGGRHRLEDEGMQGEEDTFQPRDAKSEEMEEEWEDSKRWNKMDELAKQLTSKKRMEENDSGEDPDRSMKMAFRSRKYDFSSPEEHVRRSWKHHSKEDSSEGGFPLAPMPEEKKDEEGSANRRTEVGDQELESLAAIEAELERVAHKLHELRRG
ncbi:chromogranin-A isoform X3 [Neopsephotus bourkii]|uniref:chromogranin-A isoform X3 n=1 Tax=Neopsephotus bourkii TaxID=309878 RepID=UPI002AA588AA|nr:chromogranin-A isoform X3 [Neopsephotus bourkii]